MKAVAEHAAQHESPTTTTSKLKFPDGRILRFTRSRAGGALLRIDGEGHEYLRVDPAGVWHWSGVCTSREERTDGGLVRHVRAGLEHWREHYRWSAERLTDCDGVAIRRDDHGQVVACLPGGSDPAPERHRWLYTRHGPGPVHIAGPFGARTIAMTDEGRVRSWSQDGVVHRCKYDHAGVRVVPPRPLRDHVDDAGRLWASVADDGTVRCVFLWDGTRCLARIDGPIGTALGAVFSLDPSATPVRIVTPAGVTRVPRDAYGEGLLAYPDVPGLFGGQLHGGLVHLPLRRLDPRTGSYCEPDPCDGREDDPRRAGVFEGALPVEPDPRSAYEVCRGDPVGRADPTGGVSAGLIISDLTWSFQNNVLTFFGIDWWFNLFASLIVSPFMDVEFFSSTGISSSERRGSFGIRRGGVINKITGGRAFTTQHLVWSPDAKFEELERGEVFDPRGRFTPTHYGTILSVEPEGHGRELLQSMSLDLRAWVTATLRGWSRHGGVGLAVAPGTLTPWFPAGGLHLTPDIGTRHDTACTVTELRPGAVALGDLEDRSFLTATAVTGLSAGDRVLADDGTTLAIVSVVAVVPVGSSERVQLASDLGGLGNDNLSLTQIAATPASSESYAAGAVANALEVHGSTATHAPNDLLRLTAASGQVTIARIEALEARLPLERPLPAAMPGPISVTEGAVAPASATVTLSGANLDFGTAARPAVGSTGLVSGGGSRVAVRVDAHAGASAVAIDVALPPAIAGAASVSYQRVTAGTVIGSRTGAAEAAAELTYTPNTAGTAPDGSAGLRVVHCSGGGVTHARVVTAAPNHDVLILDRTFAGTAPWSTERFPVVAGASPATGLSRADVVGLVVDDPARFASAAGVFLTKIDGEPAVPAGTPIAGVDVVGGVVSTNQPAGTPVPDLEPSRPVLVGGRAAVVRKIRVTATFDRAFDLAASGLQVVGLEATAGSAYVMTAVSANEALVLPQAALPGTSVDCPFPRFAAGDLVQVTDPATTDPTWHRVETVSGTLLRLVDGPALTAGAPDVTIRQVVTTDPGNGGPFLGIDGTRSGSGPTSTATFSVWSPAALSDGTVIGIVDGDVTRPTTVVGGSQDLELTFSEPFDLSGVDIAVLTRLADAFVTTLSRDGGVLLLEGAAGNLATAANESLIAVGFEPATESTTGVLGPGTLLVPEGEETEVDRGQALEDHELEHTLQYAKWGPLWFNAFPMLVMELPGILATDTELPEYSRFLDASLEAGSGSRWNLTIPNTAGVDIGADDELQVIQGSRRAKLKVVSISGNVYTVRSLDSGNPPAGEVSVRKQQSASVFDGFFAFFDLLTHGGLVNLLAGSTWGGIFWLIGKGVYGLGRAIGGTGDLYPATVQDGGGALTVGNADGRNNIRASGRVVVRQGENTVVRSMTRAGDVITLTEGVSFTGDVQVAMYDTHDPANAFDWYDYFPATVPDAANPARIELQSAGDDSLSLSPEDRVEIRYRSQSFKTDVLAVAGNTVELLDPVTVVDGELSLRIAKVGSHDPLGNADSTAMVAMGMGWMKWLFDPYGQIEFAAAPQQDWARWLLRVMRWLLGTQNFSLLPFGYLWWRRLFPLQPEHLAPIEQEASEESGDLYSPLGRLFGERSEDGFARYRMVVGDVGRYRYWPLARARSFVTGGSLDAPGVHFDRELRAMPNRVDTGGGTAPNLTMVADMAAPIQPGSFVAEPFTLRDADPRVIPAGDALGFTSSDLGTVPVGPRMQKTMSSYVAFTAPGDHRVTTANGITGAARAVDAHTAERQKLYFDISATDVDVTVAGQTVTNGDSVTLIPFQRASVIVTPNGSRTYRIAVTNPAQSAVLRSDGTRRLEGIGSGTGEPVELSRFYAAGASGSYGAGGLAFAGMHLSRDVHIPVRRLAVDVVDTLPLRDAAVHTAASVASLAIGDEGFLLVPAAITRAPRVTSIGGAPPAAGDPNPITRVDAPAAVGFLGAAGAAFRIAFPAGSTTGPVVITVEVGDGSAAAALTCSFALTT